MLEQVEISSFDLRYEGYRLKDKREEKNLLASILEYGIREPLQGVDTVEASSASGNRILLNGFKRYRCAAKLSIGVVPYTSLGSDEAFGIITLLRIANSKNLTVIEQARLIDELYKVHKMTVAEIAHLLEKSKGWVSMRLGMIEQMSEYVLEKIFNGQFPAYSYMYSLRPFIRMSDIKKEEIDEFVGLVSGKGLSIRDLDLLAHGYFNRGGWGADKANDDFRNQLKNGDIAWILSRLKEKEMMGAANDCTELERKVLRELESLRYFMSKLAYRGSDSRLKSPGFLAQANSLTASILKKIKSFTYELEVFHDRTKQAQCDLPASS